MITVIEYSDDPKSYDVLSIECYESITDAKLAFLNRKEVFVSLGDDVKMNTIDKNHFTWINADDPLQIVYHCRVLEF